MNRFMLHVGAYSSIFFIFMMILASGGCTVDTAEARRALEAQGVTEISFGGYAWFACSRDDTYASHWSGTGANGKRVTGVACQGWLKGTTIRFN